MIPDTEKEEIILQLQCRCKVKGCDFKGMVIEFLGHIDTCEQELAKLPEWIKRQNEKEEMIITDRYKMNFCEDTLILMSQIPQSSL